VPNEVRIVILADSLSACLCVTYCLIAISLTELTVWSRDSSRRLVNQDILRHLWIRKVVNRVHKTPPLTEW
jgi:hypothetical protein